MENVLLIKTGKSETLNELFANSIVSLGDTIRCAFLFKYFENLTWFTSNEAFPLLKTLYPQINFITEYEKIDFENYAKVINLEKDNFLLEKVSSLDSAYGFMLDQGQLKFRGMKQSKEIISEQFISNIQKPEEDCLLELLELENVEKLIMPSSYKSSNSNLFNVGLNWQVGKKWPEKNIDRNVWNDLASLIEQKGLSVSWQQGFDDISEYIKWIDSCQTIITLDSLGLHLANVLEKKVIAIFGPTNEKAIRVSNGLKIKYSQNSKDSLKSLVDSILENL